MATDQIRGQEAGSEDQGPGTRDQGPGENPDSRSPITDSGSAPTDPRSLIPDPHIAISVKNLTKTYKLYDSPQDRLKEALHPLRKPYHRDFHALRDVSFEVRHGETVGIIGQNGAGKSTLLKLITGVLAPTSGSIAVNGRISALLELGAGFNPQISGLENVYFNGTIMGFSKEEMDARLDDILAFADIGDFIHQPVRSYSSGMFMRLAFAVASSVDPDILIVDEALSVGDEAFQRKCFARINDFRERGKTILFVSHSAATIVQLCQKAHLFDGGELLLSGKPKPVVARYQKLIFTPPDKIRAVREAIRTEQLDDALELSDDKGSTAHSTAPAVAASKAQFEPNLRPKSTVSYEPRGAEISEPQILTPSGQRVNVLVRGENYIYTYKVSFREGARNVRFGMLAKTISGLELGGMASHTRHAPRSSVSTGDILQVKFPFRCIFLPGTYFLNAGVLGTIDDEEVYLHRILDALMFRVQPEPDLLPTCLVDISLNDTLSEVSIDVQ